MTSPELPISARVANSSTDEPTLIVSSGLRKWGLALTAGLAAGLIGWVITESALTRGTELARDRLKNEPLAATVWRRDAMVSFGTLGALLGLGLGVAGGLIGGAVRRGGLAGLVGLVLGGLTGAGMASWLVPIFYDNLNANDLSNSMEVNGGIWGAVGAAAGLAFGLGQGGLFGMLRGAIAGLGAGLLAMALFVFAGSILLPRAMVERPISLTPGSRFAAQLLLALSVAASVVLVETSGGKDSVGTDAGS